MTPLSELRVLDQATVQEPAKDAFFRIISAHNGTPIAADTRPQLGPRTNPLGRGNYSSPDDPGWVFFTTDSGQHCGISPDGTIAGCDDVTAEAPSDTNQTIVDDSGAPARYVKSDTTTFTRDVDVLLGGHRIENGSATCNVGYQGTVSCRIGEHGFTIAGHYGELEQSRPPPKASRGGATKSSARSCCSTPWSGFRCRRRCRAPPRRRCTPRTAPRSWR